MAKKHRKIKFKRIKALPIDSKILAAAIIIIAVVASIFLIYSKDVVVAKVNGEKLYAKRVDAVFNSLPSDSNVKKNTVMWRLVDELILRDYLKNNGYWIDDEEFSEIVSIRLAESGVTLSDLKRELKSRAASLEDIRTTFMIERFVNAEILPKITVTEEEIDLYIQLNGITGVPRETIAKVVYENHQKSMLDKIIKSHSEKLDIWVDDEYRLLYRNSTQA